MTGPVYGGRGPTWRLLQEQACRALGRAEPATLRALLDDKPTILQINGSAAAGSAVAVCVQVDRQTKGFTYGGEQAGGDSVPLVILDVPGSGPAAIEFPDYVGWSSFAAQVVKHELRVVLLRAAGD